MIRPCQGTDGGPAMPTQHDVHRTHGERTDLIVTFDGPILMQHDSNNWGKTTLTLVAGDKEVSRFEQPGNWHCLGFSKLARKFVVQEIGEVISYPAIVAIEYVDENDHHRKQSAFSRGKYVAVSYLASPDYKYVAFVGSNNLMHRYKLYCLDLEKDTIRFLGEPPAPPPISKSDLAAGMRPYQWGWEAEGLTDLPHSIWSFESADTLSINYGHDTWKSRDKHRRTKRFQLR